MRAEGHRARHYYRGMISGPTALAFALASIALLVVPGPGVLFVIGRSLAYGRIGGLLSVLGGALGMVPLVALVAVGVGAIVAQSLLWCTIIKYVGAAYIIWLGIQTIRHRHRNAAATVEAPTRSKTRLVAEGFVVGVSNPKTIAFFVAVLPQFVDPQRGAVQLQMVQLGLIFVALALVSDGIWALVAGTARAWFATSPTRIERLTLAGGVTMIGIGVILALSESRTG